MRLDAYTATDESSIDAESSGTVWVGDGANVLCGIRNRHTRVLRSEPHIAFGGDLCLDLNHDKRAVV